MKISQLATKATTALVAAGALAGLQGCATDGTQPGNGSLLDRAGAMVNSARTTVANAISPTATTEKKSAGVEFGNAACKAKMTDGSAVRSAARTVAGNLTNPNNECVSITVKDNKKGSTVKSETVYGLITAENCSPTAAGAASIAGSYLTNLGARALGQAASNQLPGAAGNVVRTQTQRANVSNGNDLRGQITSGNVQTLTAEQQVACKADLAIVSAAITAQNKDLSAKYAAANKGAVPVVTINATADLSSLNLGATARAPR